MSILMLLLSFLGAQAQISHIEEIELMNMGSFYRLMVHSSGQMAYVEKYRQKPPRLDLYVKNAKLRLKKKHLRLKNVFVKTITAQQWKKSPAIVKLTFSFSRPLNYTITQKIPGLIYLDLRIPLPSSPQPKQDGATGKLGTQHKRKKALEKSVNILFEEAAEKVPPPASNAYYRSVSIKKPHADRVPAPLRSDALISLDVKAAEISNVLRLLAKQTKLNIVASREVSGKVTVSLSNVSIKQALDAIAKANGYEYVVEGEVILVKPRDKFQLQELKTKVFRLQYIDASNLKSTLSKVLSDQAKIQVFNYDFQPAAESAVGQKAQAKSRSSTLIVTDTAEKFPQLEAIIEALDVPTPQIMIEAKLIEIAPQNEQKLGIDWSKTINAQIFREIILPSGLPFRYTAEVPLEGGSVNFGTLKFGEYQAVLDFLDTHTNSKLVSNPRILAMDNQEAVIKVGTNVPIPQINRGVGGQGDVVTFEY
ncbi:MAG: secretin N-terminal domain-containing protein, partial [bacterium]